MITCDCYPPFTQDRREKKPFQVGAPLLAVAALLSSAAFWREIGRLDIAPVTVTVLYIKVVPEIFDGWMGGWTDGRTDGRMDELNDLMREEEGGGGGGIFNF